MTRVKVGGRERDITKEEVIRKMRGVEPEPVREHLVEIAGTAYPPKQVLETVTDWDRRSFTSLEAVRVLTRVGLVCRRESEGQPTPVPGAAGNQAAGIERRLSELEAALAVAQEAIARLANRVTTLEAATQ
ncbi:MAG: SCO5918 family protein [Streptosporangiaceae bacterium]